MVSQAWIGAFGAKESTREELAGGGECWVDTVPLP
jgi:hypothetical protein